MGFRSFFGLDAAPAVEAAVASSESLASGVRFSTSIDPGTLYGYATVEEAVRVLGAGGDVSRDVAIRVPAAKRARDLIAGGLGQLPLHLHSVTGAVESWALFEQPEECRAPSVTWTDVLDDMLFQPGPNGKGIARLQVTHHGWHGKPAQVRRMIPGKHSKGLGGWWVNRDGKPAEWVPDAHVIEIESPNDALLKAGARAIRVLARLEVGALNAVDGIPPMDYFTHEGDSSPFEDDDDAQDFLDAWLAARQARATGLIPEGLKYNANSVSPKDLQLVEAREFAIAEIARLTGVDAEELGVSTTSRTYFNAQDRRRGRIDFTLGPYRSAVEGRLSMPDVTPRGYVVRFDTSEFTRADDLTTAQTDKVLIDAEIMTRDEVRARRGLEPLPASAAAPVPAEVGSQTPEQETVA